jgi:tyrosinase-like protein
MAKSRRDIDSLSDAELGDYIHALDVLRQRSAANPDDEAGFDFQAALHNDMFIGSCEHGSDLFFPWHRAHLHYFEKLLQETDPPRTANVTVPYWDWIHAEPNKFPAAFDEQGLSEGDRNTDPDTPLPSDTLEIVTTETSWPDFGGYPAGDPKGNYGRLELGPHNYMHPTFIGGKMANPGTAAEDPIYFSFHCFIDLMWAEWQRRNGMAPATSPDHDLRGFLSQPKHKVGDVQDTKALDYVYEYSDKLKDAFDVPAPSPVARELVSAEPLQPAFDQGVARTLRETERLEYRLPAAQNGGTSVVRLRVAVPKSGSYTLEGYLHPADVEFDRSDAQAAKRYFVGYASAWRGHEMPEARGDERPHPHHPPSLTARFDLTKAMASDSADRILTLEWTPAPSPTGAREVAPELASEVAVEDVAVEVYR